jgi:RNA polymerase sigma factor (sigma-70 family)
MSRPHVAADYEAINNLGKALDMKINCAFIIGEWDPDNRLKDIPNLSKWGNDWDNVSYIDKNKLIECIDVINNSPFIDIAVHGLMHGYYIENTDNPDDTEKPESEDAQAGTAETGTNETVAGNTGDENAEAEGENADLIQHGGRGCAEDHGTEASAEQRLAQKNTLDKLYKLIDALPDREQQILIMHYGLFGGKKYSLEEIGLKFNLTRERIRQLEIKVLKTLRSPENRRCLDDFIAGR